MATGNRLRLSTELNVYLLTYLGQDQVFSTLCSIYDSKVQQERVLDIRNIQKLLQPCSVGTLPKTHRHIAYTSLCYKLSRLENFRPQ